MHAGVVLASIRMALWVLLLAADVPWLTDNNTSIAGMLCAQSPSCLPLCLSECLSVPVQGLVHHNTPFLQNKHAFCGCPNLYISPAVLQRILGVQVNWHHLDRIPNKRHVLVSNHLTAGDLMMLYSLPQHYIHLISAKLPERISQVWTILPKYQAVTAQKPGM